jgi:hypothetical protein
MRGRQQADFQKLLLRVSLISGSSCIVLCDNVSQFVQKIVLLEPAGRFN